ncbi:pilus assembly protein [Roseovarius sp. LXJ103]|uniref:TadE/TadG family type IV pilus assembly protein n=1 Tax=Roseovarius carneus TaxID=2853164 RepID=UPI000D60DE2B|nr:TadE/TadG family type IV pilus assembly protein [Roseovarius carneus]MBZ8118682.1 pilus assembly protein [Roseovarius carneus]PWE35636.1 pilus assembly protein TadE [Pelagicola sp. LXJ1103]
MIKIRKNLFRRFARDEDGAVTAEFAVVFPIFMALMILSLELSFVTMRHTMLERGLDMAVRDIRLGTGTAPAHDAIKQRICAESFVFNNCEENLRLEMIPTDIRNLGNLSDTAQCTDRAETGDPVITFTPGQQNQLMLLRACVKYDPLFPGYALANALESDENGQISIVSMTAFVQEPQ